LGKSSIQLIIGTLWHFLPRKHMKTWFITGTSRGFGREWTQAALERGDRVAATARNLDSLDDLVQQFGDRILPLHLDVTDRAADFAAVKAAHEQFGRLDVIVNNAGYGLFGAIEEVTESEARAQLETNLFGAMWITQAALPYLRSQGSGHIIQISSLGGIGAFPLLGLYHAAKWGLEGFSEALSQEVAPLGIKVTIVEPGGFSTDWSGSSAVHAQPLAEYDGLRNARATRTAGAKSGDPAASSMAILKLVDTKNPPLRLLLGTAATQIVPQIYEQRLKVWAEWTDVARAADGN
jgi:NAD(P)-dependent dehydrogenase (short-subunit alcohol dehydrogenase family)